MHLAAAATLAQSHEDAGVCPATRRAPPLQRSQLPFGANLHFSLVAEAKAGLISAPCRMRSSAGTTASDETQPRDVAVDPLLDYAYTGHGRLHGCFARRPVPRGAPAARDLERPWTLSEGHRIRIAVGETDT